jgi:glycosyltransferase involved in cell wall biosynthesis
MYKNKKIAVVIRAYNEEEFIPGVVNSIPDFVDRIYIVNDASTDGTIEIISNLSKRDNRIVAVNHRIRGGAGYAAISGQKRALIDKNDLVAIIDGDGQMDSAFLTHFLDPLVSGEADYVKGNRFSMKEHLKEMPVWRLFGNFLLTYLTRIASGYWDINDPQNGYTAMSKETLKKLDLEKVEKGFAYENDMLVKLNIVGARIRDVPHPAIYRGQRSNICYCTFIFTTSWVLFKGFLWRLWAKYLLNTVPKMSNDYDKS